MRIAIAFIFIVGFMLTCMGLNPAWADDVEASGVVSTGVTSEGFNYTATSVTVYKPLDVPEFFGVLPAYVTYEIRILDGDNILDRMLATYELGDSTNFTGELIVDGDNSYIGAGYKFDDHLQSLDFLQFKMLVGEGGTWLAAVDGEKEVLPGYGVFGEIYAYFDTDWSTTDVNWVAGAYHNLESTGAFRAELAYQDTFGKRLTTFTLVKEFYSW